MTDTPIRTLLEAELETLAPMPDRVPQARATGARLVRRRRLARTGAAVPAFLAAAAVATTVLQDDPPSTAQGVPFATASHAGLPSTPTQAPSTGTPTAGPDDSEVRVQLDNRLVAALEEGLPGPAVVGVEPGNGQDLGTYTIDRAGVRIDVHLLAQRLPTSALLSCEAQDSASSCRAATYGEWHSYASHTRDDSGSDSALLSIGNGEVALQASFAVAGADEGSVVPLSDRALQAVAQKITDDDLPWRVLDWFDNLPGDVHQVATPSAPAS